MPDDALEAEIAAAEARLAALKARADQSARGVDSARGGMGGASAGAVGGEPGGREPVRRASSHDEMLVDSAVTEEMPAGSGRRGRPVRAVLLDMLYDVGVPTYSRECAQLMQALYGRRVAASRFGVLSADEESGYVKGRARSVYLGHALTYERFEAIKRLWVRSDWSLSDRVMTPTSGRTRHLAMTKRLCELAVERRESAVQPQMLAFAAADHAADLPGVRIVRGVFELDRWAAIAGEMLEGLADEDRRAREEAARRLAGLPERARLFGRPPVAAINDDAPPRGTFGSGSGRLR